MPKPLTETRSGVRKLPYFVSSPTAQFVTIPTRLTRSGTTVDDWKAKIKNKFDATSNYSRREVLVETKQYGLVEQKVVNRISQSESFNYVRGYPPCALLADHDADGFVPSFADNNAKGQFVARVNKRLSELQGGVAVAELGKAVKSVLNPFNSLASLALTATRALEKRLIGRRRRQHAIRRTWTKDQLRRNAEAVIQESWLESQMAWLPMVSDLKGVMRGLSRVLNGITPEAHVSSDEMHFDELVKANSLDSTVGTFLGGAVCKISRRYRVSGFVRYKGAIGAEFLLPGFSTFGFRLEQFLPSLWEWLPYSWLLDYALPVGDYLDAISFPTSKLVYATRAISCETREIHESQGLTAFTSGHPLYELDRYDHSSGFVIVRKSYVRTNAKQFGFFIPTISRENMKFSRLLNVGALLLSQKVCREVAHKMLTLEKVEGRLVD